MYAPIKRGIFLGLLVLFAMPLVVHGESVIDSSLAKVVNSAGPDSKVNVMITLAQRSDLSVIQERIRSQRRTRLLQLLQERAERSQASLLEFLRGKGAENINSYWISNAVSATLQANDINALAKQPWVKRISLNSITQAPVLQTINDNPSEWNINAIHAPDLWTLGVTGENTVVAVLDTGVDMMHPDLYNNWRGGTNSWFDAHGQHELPFDSNGHGTHVTSVIVGGDAGGSYIGVAPGAQWIAAKVFDDNGNANVGDFHAGLQWVLDPDGDPTTDDAPDVVNNSWGFINNAGCNQEFADDIAVLRMAEIAVVFGAGNNGPDPGSSASPGDNPGSFASGAVSSSLTVDKVSSRGPSNCDSFIFPEVVAPGVNVKTADLSYGGFAFYTLASGTSLAAPHSSGAFALLRSALPHIGVIAMEAAIKDSALDLGIVGPDSDYGYGLINVADAYNLLLGQAPIAVDDVYNAESHQTLTIASPGLLDNDADPNANILTAVLLSLPTHGQLQLDNTGAFSYTPDSGFSGEDMFTYSIEAGGVMSDPATVYIKVEDNSPPLVNTAPIIISTPVTTAAEGVPYSYDVDATDAEGDDLTYSLEQAPAGMVIDTATGLIQWTPNADQVAIQAVTVRVADSRGLFDDQAFDIDVSVAGISPCAWQRVGGIVQRLTEMLEKASLNHDSRSERRIARIQSHLDKILQRAEKICSTKVVRNH